MADYSVFALGESQMTINGGQLDGVTQGDGSHMVGLTLTLNSNAWEEVLVTDNDSNFEDSDSSQRLDGAQSFDGVSYAANTVLEAEYSIVLSDGTNTWTAIAFNINNSSPSYGTVEGLAFIGGPGGFPPVGVELEVLSANEAPNFASAAYATPICFARGTQILTATGPCPIEELRIDDLIQTADHGLQPLRWVGGRQVLGVGRFAPVEIAAGLFGATRPLTVSQQHRLAVSSTWSELHVGERDVFVPAIHLVDGSAVRMRPCHPLEYYHLVLDRHEVIFANGVASESLHCAAQVPNGEFADMVWFFPELTSLGVSHEETARRCLRRYEAELMIAWAGGVERLHGLRHSARDESAGGLVRAVTHEERGHVAGYGLGHRIINRLERLAG